MDGIRRVVSYSTQPDWGNSPMRTRRKTGEIFYNEKYLKRRDLTQDHWNLFRTHEEGHVMLDTHDEHEADEYARQRYFPSGRSLRASVDAMMKVLDWQNNREHLQRLLTHLQEAERFDCEVNGNKKVCDNMGKPITYSNSIDSNVRGASVLDGTGFDYFTAAPSPCGPGPTLQTCDGRKKKREICADQNKYAMDIWQNCVREHTSQSETAALIEQFKIDTDRTQELATQTVKSQEITEGSNVNIVKILAVVAIVGAALLMVFFIMKPKAKTA